MGQFWDYVLLDKRLRRPADRQATSSGVRVVCPDPYTANAQLGASLGARIPSRRASTATETRLLYSPVNGTRHQATPVTWVDACGRGMWTSRPC